MLVQVRRPDGAVIITTHKAFEVLHRPKGWERLEIPGVDPNRGVSFMAARGGGERLRSRWPAEALAAKGWNTTTVLGWPMGVTPGAVIVLHRPLAEGILDWVRAYREHGCTVLVSEDDDLNTIPRLNTWRANAEQLRDHDQSIREADGLIVTTPALAEVYGPLAKRTWLCPNYLPAWVSSPEFLASIVKPDDGRVRIGWAGILNTHRQDLVWLRPQAKRMIAGAVFTTVGDIGALRLLGITGEAEGPQKDITKYYRLMGRPDIGIVPLDIGANRAFNTSKSWLKALEFVSLGVPVVAVDLPEQRALLEGTDAGVLVGSPKEMAEAVQELVKDAPRRARMAAAALELGRRMVIENHVECWETVLKDTEA